MTDVYKDRRTVLVHANTWIRVKEGDVITDESGDEYRIVSGIIPHKPSSSGKVAVVNHEADPSKEVQRVYYPFVFKLRFVEEIKKLAALVLLQDELKADGPGSVDGRFVLCFLEDNKHTPYVVWFHNFQDGGYHNGNYFSTYNEAEKVYDARREKENRKKQVIEVTHSKPKRFAAALGIVEGAINPSGISLAIHEGCKECIAEGTDMRTDPAIRLMVNQLAFIMKDILLSQSLDEYSQALNECHRLASKNKE